MLYEKCYNVSLNFYMILSVCTLEWLTYIKILNKLMLNPIKEKQTLTHQCSSCSTGGKITIF